MTPIPKRATDSRSRGKAEGGKAESLGPKQLELLLVGLEALSAPAPVAETPAPTRAPATARPVRQPLPANLETERVVLETAEVQ